MADSPYFDSTYFDGAYFDVDVTAPSAGGGKSGRPSKGRRRTPVSIQKPPEPPSDTEDWVSLIL